MEDVKTHIYGQHESHIFRSFARMGQLSACLNLGPVPSIHRVMDNTMTISQYSHMQYTFEVVPSKAENLSK